MNERFKFRVFDKETGKYYKSRINKCSGRTLYQHPSSSHCVWVSISTLFAELEQDKKTYIRTGVEPDTIIEQCTGLKDKNGNLIYEGDVIKDEFYRRFTIVWSEEDCMFEGRVIYRDPEYSDRFDLYKGATDDCEIIGNIHEQPE